MKKPDRKAAIAAYQDQTVASGVYVVRCTASGQIWAGGALNLATIQNRLWFGLRLGGDRNPTLQAAWNTHGADAFTFEVAAQLPEEEEDSTYPRSRLLAKLLGEWVEKLQAIKI